MQCFKAHARVARRRNGEPSVAHGSRLHTVTFARVVLVPISAHAPRRPIAPPPEPNAFR